MIQRRILTDDGRGLKDILNETLPNGQGVRVMTRHIAEVGSTSNAPKLRWMFIDEPLQQFYTTENVTQPKYQDYSLT